MRARVRARVRARARARVRARVRARIRVRARAMTSVRVRVRVRVRVCLGAGALGTLEEGAAAIRLDEAIGPGVHQQSIGDTHPFERALTAWRH